jgi:hypothetical protein
MNELSSPARGKLSELVAARAEHVANADRLRATKARAEVVTNAEGPIIAALSELDAKESAAAFAWLENGEGAAPAADAKKRAKLTTELAQARANAVAMRAAEAEVNAKIGKEEEAAWRLQSQINLAVAEIIVAEVDALTAPFKAAQTALSVTARQLSQGFGMLPQLAHGTAGVEEKAAIFALIEPLDDKVKAMLALPVESQAVQDATYAAWGNLAQRLNAGDASATLDNRT